MAVLQHEAEDRVVEKLIELFTDNFDTELDALYNRDGDGVTQAGGLGTYTAGVYLPAPPSAYYHRQSGPTTNTAKDLGFVAAFVGPTGEAVPVSRNGLSNQGQAFTMQQNFAITFVLSRSANQAVADSLTGRNLREEEVFVKRARYYTGAIAHTCWKHARGLDEIRRIEPLGRTSQQAEMELASDQYELVGISSFEFSVYNHQIFPQHS